MTKIIIKKYVNSTMIWDIVEKRSHLISNEEAAKLERKQNTKEEPTADKAKEKPKQKNTKTEAKKEETTDGE
ncbi:hypothetical protein MOE37_07655 [Bacillus atrophaeus]|uniref:hypothetical protein n=1 Tax=Bacillus atrophaeus TaxID=1452 RepID=UPI00227E5FC6|nr:hypothetical protein [Bacillus atrophaeus]MCY8971465.1 hypothetical protein [Bacillus atrophaeus]